MVGKRPTARDFLLDCRSGTGCVLPHSHEVSHCSFSPDGKTLATVCNNRIFLWQVATGQELAQLATEPREIVMVQFFFRRSPTGRRSRTDIRRNASQHAYPDSPTAHTFDKATAVVTIWSGIEGESLAQAVPLEL